MQIAHRSRPPTDAGLSAIGTLSPTSARRGLPRRKLTSTSAERLSAVSGRVPARKLAARAAAGATGSAPQPDRPAVLLESDAAVLDLHVDGHRVAFNRAFDALKLPTKRWTPDLYHHLRQCGDGSATGMLKTWFNTAGWPVTMAKSDHRGFAHTILRHKDEALLAMLRAGEVPLRDGPVDIIDAACVVSKVAPAPHPGWVVTRHTVVTVLSATCAGVADIVDAALAAGAAVALLGATCSVPEEEALSAAAFALGARRCAALRFFTCGVPVEQDDGSEAAPPPASFEAGFSAIKAQVKQREGEAFVRTMKGVGLDPSMAAMQLRRGLLTPAWLQSVAAVLGASPVNTVVIGANELPLNAAKSAGMAAIAVPTSLSTRMTPATADACFADGYGAGGGLTWNRVIAILDRHAARQEL